MLASVGEIAEYASASAAIGRLWKNSRQLNKQILALNEFSQSIFFLREEGLQVQTALSLFTVNAFCQLPSVDMSMPNSHARSNVSLRHCWILARAFVH